MARKKILFLQLPHLDNDVTGPFENLPMAAVYLAHALRRAHPSASYELCLPSGNADLLDDAHLAKQITEEAPDIIACTLYLWNIERTLRVLELLRSALPRAQMIAGGPEVSKDHPFLLKSAVPDIVVQGEGETVFPRLAGDKLGVSFQNTGRRSKNGFKWGRADPPPAVLARCLPPADSPLYRPDVNGMAYLEFSRGCPMLCSYCRYNQSRSAVSSISADKALLYIRALAEKGAKEIRFVDPTFNSRPEFETLLEAIAELNADRSLRFFAELKAERLTGRQARLLGRANFAEIEVGVQSTNPAVLRRIRRPTDIPAVEKGIRLLLKNSIVPTVDLMYGLPTQTIRDVEQAIGWARQFKGANIQHLHTLLLPGTTLRAEQRKFRIEAMDLPPYGVLSTGAMSEKDMAQAELMVAESSDAQLDAATRRFVGRRLQDLFPN